MRSSSLPFIQDDFVEGRNMLKNLLIIFTAFILFSNQQINAQELNFSLSLTTKLESAEAGVGKYEPSAIVSIENTDFLLIADDKSPELLVVSKDKGVVVGKAVCIDKSQGCDLFPTISNPKWEAMAKDGDEIYIIGAYRKSENKEKIFLSFRIKKEVGSNFIIYSVVKFEIENIFAGINDSKPRVEGLAIRKFGDSKELLIGIRNIDLDNEAKK